MHLGMLFGAAMSLPAPFAGRSGVAAWFGEARKMLACGGCMVVGMDIGALACRIAGDGSESMPMMTTAMTLGMVFGLMPGGQMFAPRLRAPPPNK